MNQLDGITVSNIAEIITIRAPRGRRMKIANRRFFGLSFCTSGKITYRHGGKCFVSKPGVAVILPMHASYELYNNEGGEFPLINFYCAGKGFTDEFICIPLGKDDVYIKDYERMKSLSFSEANRLADLGIFYEILSRSISAPGLVLRRRTTRAPERRKPPESAGLGPTSSHCWYNAPSVRFVPNNSRKSTTVTSHSKSAEDTKRLSSPLPGCCSRSSTICSRRMSRTTLNSTARTTGHRHIGKFPWKKPSSSSRDKATL